MAREQLARIAGWSAFVLAVIVVAVLLVAGGSSYKVYAEFSDAGQLVSGDLVTVAGHGVGQVGAITLSDNGLAKVELDISDSNITLREGTFATIGQLSLTGVANRFVGLTLSGYGRKIGDGGTIPPTQTKGIVDLDVLLNSLTPQVRASLQQIFKTGAYVFKSPSPQQFNQAMHYLNPALSQTTQLGAEIVADKFALDRLISSTADISTTLAARNGDLGGAVTSTAAAFRQIASRRAALQDIVASAPAVLSQAEGVLKDVDFTLGVLNPTLTHLQPVAPKLSTLITKLLPAAANAVPTIQGVEALVPSARRALKLLPPVEKAATPAIQSLSSALSGLTPLLAGVRPYAPDLVAGFFTNFSGAETASYDANGQFGRVMAMLSPGGAGLTGLLSLLGGVTSAIGPLNGTQTGVLARCPGGAAPKSSDQSSPWTAPDVLPATGSICNPADNAR
jgi:phospholipid/cholesterol/gamma-HCH transport system substrate-binding protein